MDATHTCVSADGSLGDAAGRGSTAPNVKPSRFGTPALAALRASHRISTLEHLGSAIATSSRALAASVTSPCPVVSSRSQYPISTRSESAYGTRPVADRG